MLRAGTKAAVLGLVLQRPSYGYELASRFDRVFGQPAWDWGVSPSAIYKALNDLEAECLIEPFASEFDATTRQPKTHYRATPRGARAMREYLAAPLPVDPSQSDFLIRINSGLDLHPDGLIAMLEEYARTCLGTLADIAKAPPAGTAYERLVRKQRRLTVQAQLTWIDYALAEVRASP